MSDHSAIANV